MVNASALHGLLFVGGLALASGCRSPVDEPNSGVPGQCQAAEPLVEAQKLDILFVIDNSGSMAEEQEGVARELTAFVDEVRKGGGVAQDFRVGVVTTSVYQHTKINDVVGLKNFPTQSGKLQAVPDAAPDGGVLQGTGAERVLSGEDPELVEKFARLVRVGIQGSGQETAFEAARLALTDLATVPTEQAGTAGLLRDRARLLVVVVTDEDDCSETARPPKVTVGDDPAKDDCAEQNANLQPVSYYFDLFSNLKDGTGAVRDIVWATIGPVGRARKEAELLVDDGQVRNVDCPTSYAPGFRHREMAARFDATLANLDSICRASYRETLIAIAGLANISQTLDVRNVPDPRLLQVEVVRRDDATEVCTLGNKGLTAYDLPTQDRPARIHFGNQCRRRADDKEVRIKMLCAG